MWVLFARACYACVVILGVAGGATARAADAVEPTGELTLAAAIESALRTNPDLAVRGYEITVSEARIAQSRLRPNPELALDLENFAGSGALEGTDALETTLSLSQVVELGGKRASRVAASEAALDVVSIERRGRELDVLADATRRFIDVVAAQERARVAADATALAQASLDAI